MSTEGVQIVLPIKRAMIGAIVRMVPGDERRATMVERVGLAGKRRAQRSFAHFRNGSGAPVHIRTDRLLADDAGVRDALLRSLCGVGPMTADGTATRVHVSQTHFTNKDWCYALGSVDFECRPVPGGFEVRALGRYDWHPEEARPTRAIHEMAARMERRGARAFDIVGDPVRIERDEIESVPRYRVLPIRTFLM